MHKKYIAKNLTLNKDVNIISVVKGKPYTYHLDASIKGDIR